MQTFDDEFAELAQDILDHMMDCSATRGSAFANQRRMEANDQRIFESICLRELSGDQDA